MLGLHTKNGWRAGFAIAVTGTLIGIGSGAAVAAPAVTRAEAQAVNATGGLVEILDTGDCKTTTPKAYPGGTPPNCGELLSTSSVSAFAQAVEGRNNGFSRAFASVAPIDVDGLGDINLTNVFQGLNAAQTNTILDPILNGLGGLTAVQLAQITQPVSDGVQTVLDGVNGALPVNLVLGAVESQAAATAKPKSASGSSVVADANLVVGEGVLGANGVVVPLTGPNAADTPPNTPLLVGAPQDLAVAILDTLEDTLVTSITGELGPLAPLIANIRDMVVVPLLTQLEPELLQPLSDGLAPLIQGTVNKQTPVSPTNTGKIEVIALEVILLDAAGAQGRQTLQLARVAVGPNSAATETNTPPPPPPNDEDDSGDPDDGDDDGDGDDGDGPKSVDSGLNDGGNLGALAITGLLAASTLIGSAARQRLLLGR